MELLRKWNSISLIVRIIIGLVLGAVLGFALPQATVIGLLGDLFVGALKALAPMLVFFIVMHALCKKSSGTNTNMSTVIVLYLVSTFMAALTAVIASFAFPSELILTDAVSNAAPGGVWEVLKNLLTNAVSNPVASLSSANYIGILFWAVIFGLALRNASDTSKDFLGNVADALSVAIRWVISFAPFGIMGLMYSTISTTGFAALATYARLIVVLVVCMLFCALVINPIMVFVCIHKNPYPLVFRCIRESGIMAFFTRSSAANIPVNMKLCHDLGLDEEKYSVSIPLGATINMAGAAVTITVLALAAAHTVGVEVSFGSAFLLSLVASVSACGASGVAGGSLLLIPLACSLFGIPNDVSMQVVGVGFIIGVIQDSCETAVNSSSDVVFTATAEFMSRKKAGKKMGYLD